MIFRDPLRTICIVRDIIGSGSAFLRESLMGQLTVKSA
jgi:hypothetical protein